MKKAMIHLAIRTIAIAWDGFFYGMFFMIGAAAITKIVIQAGWLVLPS